MPILSTTDKYGLQTGTLVSGAGSSGTNQWPSGTPLPTTDTESGQMLDYDVNGDGSVIQKVKVVPSYDENGDSAGNKIVDYFTDAEIVGVDTTRISTPKQTSTDYEIIRDVYCDPANPSTKYFRIEQIDVSVVPHLTLDVKWRDTNHVAISEPANKEFCTTGVSGKFVWENYILTDDGIIPKDYLSIHLVNVSDDGTVVKIMGVDYVPGASVGVGKGFAALSDTDVPYDANGGKIKVAVSKLA